MKILLRSTLSPFTGYGNDGIEIALYLSKAGHDVLLRPQHVDPPLPPEVALLMAKPLEAPFDMVISHTDPSRLWPSKPERRNAKVAVGWTMWEYTSLENCKKKKSLKKHIGRFDVLFSYDPVSFEAFDKIIDPTKVAHSVLQGGINPERWPYVDRDLDRPLRFCMTGQLHERKDPFVVIDAFRELQSEYPEFDAELHLKNQIPTLHPGLEEIIPRLKIHYRNFTQQELLYFYHNCDVLISASRGEGKCVPALEMMCTGGTVIATDWGGHQVWLNPDYSYPLECSIMPYKPGADPCNARASKDHLKKLMLNCWQNRGEVREKGRLAARTIPVMCSWDRVIDRFFLKLKEIGIGG